MNRKRATIVTLILMFIVSSGMFISSCKHISTDGWIVLTQSAVKNDINSPNPSLTNVQSRIVSIDPGKTENIKVLSEGFYSAMSPEISYDGQFMLFSAQKTQNDRWQVYEMNLSDQKTRQITSSSVDHVYPQYLPNGRIVFDMNTGDTARTAQSLFTCNPDGTDLKKITFNSYTYLYPAVLQDGRILTVCMHEGNRSLMVLRPDGTKAELFYKSESEPSGKGFETMSGKIVFLEKSGSSGTGITSINYNRPLHTRINLTSGIKGDFHAVVPLSSGKLLVVYRPSEYDNFALYEFDPDTKVLGKVVYSNKDYNVIDASTAERRERPKKLPSEVDMGVKTGLLLCQDIKISDHSNQSVISSIEVIGKDSSLGKINIEKDGSFYLKVMADQPFQIRALDAKGNVVGRQCDWIWLRANERRGCVGCHEDNEQVPENRVPLAVKNLPVNIPVHIIKVKEKKVSLE